MANTSVSKGTNPKDLIGAKKVSLGAVPPIALAHESCAMMDGEWKYGYRNWRDNPVQARIYIDACKRHLDAWLEGQETAPDSGVHHLGHARACLGIILDAQATGNLVDDRSHNEEAYTAEMDKLNEWAMARRKFHDGKRSEKEVAEAVVQTLVCAEYRSQTDHIAACILCGKYTHCEYCEY